MAKAIIWKCYNEVCGHIGKREEFTDSTNGPKCPKCGMDDCTFPHRMYKCRGCGKVGDQNFWFDESPLDEDPFESRYEANPCEDCIQAWDKKNMPRGHVSNERWTVYEKKFLGVREKPADLEEISV